MRILLDLQALQNGSRTRGIGRYVSSLLRSLAAQRSMEIWGLLNTALEEHLDEAKRLAGAVLGHDRILLFHGLDRTAEIEEQNRPRRLAAERAYELFVDSFQFDALLVGSLFEGFEDQTIISLRNHEARYRKYVVLYDLIPLLNAEQFLGWDKINNWYHDRLEHLLAADGLLAISESARQEALEHLRLAPEKVVAIGTATDPDLFSPIRLEKTGVADRLKIARPYIMHASAFDERKNFAGLLRAYAALPPHIRDQHQLVFAGGAKTSARAELEELRDSLGVDHNDLIFTGHVSDEELAELYRGCSLFVFPSFHEGFGLPALEAMSCGCPAIGSDRSSVPEVIGRTDLLFDPADTKAMTALIARFLHDPDLRRKAAEHALEHARTFNWAIVAERAAAALTKGEASVGPRRQSLADNARSIVRAVGATALSDNDLQQLAVSLVGNDEERYAFFAELASHRSSEWRIEGPFDSSYSLALLNRETARALRDLGFAVSLHSTEGPGDFEPNPAFLQAHPDHKAMHDRGKSQGQGSADVTSRLLYPPRVKDLTGQARALHHYAWEESGFPQEWVEEFNANLTFMTCLSSHVEKLMIDNGVTVPLLTSGCGVDHWERVIAEPGLALPKAAFTFLHVSSCFPRKGVDLLLSAYAAAFSANDDVLLVIKTFDNPHNEVSDQLARLKSGMPNFPRVELIKGDLTEGQLKALYQQCDVMVGPSCAEGYGLPFAEAMLSGIPVITTAWGGQLDFCNEGNSWLVDYEFERAQTHFGLWNSVWARADVAALADAMRDARGRPVAERSSMAERGRRQLLARHKWSDVAKRLAAATELLATPRPALAPRIGWLSTWQSRCGVATYSAHLIEAVGGDVTVYAPINEEHAPDEGSARRCWSLGKTNRCYDELFEAIARDEIETLVIQFNYNFFDNAELGRLIRKVQRHGIAVVIFIHSTIDPVGEPRPELFNLSFFAGSLQQCDRILVHSVADLNRLKAIGLIDNVTLFPHGVLEVMDRPSSPRNSIETISTYGFALPNKGLEELIEATAILHRRGRRVRLRMINAEYPAPESRQVLEAISRRVAETGLEQWIERHHDFLSDERCLDLLQDSDLAVFPYQRTGESASGAARYGIATKVPVATTPVPIFDDLRGATFRFTGVTPEALADGLEEFLDHIRNASALAQATQEAADSWRAQHAYSALGRRLRNMFMALVNQKGSAVGRDRQGKGAASHLDELAQHG